MILKYYFILIYFYLQFIYLFNAITDVLPVFAKDFTDILK